MERNKWAHKKADKRWNYRNEKAKQTTDNDNNNNKYTNSLTIQWSE